ncbi:MAG TPA: Rrf2 family transcriptional regulator [Planctomycetota bacterium]|nr:Rrf2 family transcriptional regulator [Planctomycetota bacterium]
MLSQTTKYALQTLAAMVDTPDEWHEVKRLSEELSIPANYLSKVLGQLAKIGILESRKGWGGGFRFRRRPSEVSLDEVVRFLEGPEHARTCIFGLPVCSDENPCPLHHEWKKAREIYERLLAESTVADLALPPDRAQKPKASGVKKVRKAT